jgi:hypothetical protein
LLSIAACTAAVAGFSAAPALAGEVKGPPGPGVPTQYTAARTHANSICAYSGLNDFINGPTMVHTQSYGTDVSGKGDPADPHVFNPGDICQGGSNPNHP